MFAIALGMTKLETFTVLFSSIIFIGAFTWVSIKGDLRKIAEELINDTEGKPEDWVLKSFIYGDLDNL